MGLTFIDAETKSKLRLCIYGDSNAGKTTFASSAADVGNTLLVSFHAQPQVVAEKEDKFELVPVQIDHLTDLSMIIQWLYDSKSNGFGGLLKAKGKPDKYDFVIFDGFTVMQRVYMQIILRPDLDNDAPMYLPRTSVVHAEDATMRHWGVLANFTNELTSSFYGLDDYHVIITCYESKTFDPPTVMGQDPRLRGIQPDIQGSGYNLLVGRSNVLARITWDGKDSVLRIRQSSTVTASYRYSDKIPEKTTLLTNSNIRELMCLGE